MFKKNNKVLPDIISLFTFLEYVEWYVAKCKTKLQTKIKQFDQPQYSAFAKYKFVCHNCTSRDYIICK